MKTPQKVGQSGLGVERYWQASRGVLGIGVWDWDRQGEEKEESLGSKSSTLALWRFTGPCAGNPKIKLKKNKAPENLALLHLRTVQCGWTVKSR